jgi:hypothetical protein
MDWIDGLHLTERHKHGQLAVECGGAFSATTIGVIK